MGSQLVFGSLSYPIHRSYSQTTVNHLTHTDLNIGTSHTLKRHQQNNPHSMTLLWHWVTACV